MTFKKKSNRIQQTLLTNIAISSSHTKRACANERASLGTACGAVLAHIVGAIVYGIATIGAGETSSAQAAYFYGKYSNNKYLY